MNVFKKGIEVDYFHGATVINDRDSKEHKGLTMGNMINAWGFTGTDDPMLYLEYGHMIQSRIFGPLYLPVIGIPSAAVAGKDNGPK